MQCPTASLPRPSVRTRPARRPGARRPGPRRLGVRRLGVLVAAALPLLGLAGCAGSDRIAFIALVGEAPGDKPLYTGLSASGRFNRPAPPIRELTYRPAALPAGEAPAALAPLAERARAARLNIGDRADDYELRRRYLALNVSEYRTAAAAIAPIVGRPLVAMNPATETRIAAVQQALGRLQADIVALHGILLRQEQAKAVATAIAAELKQAGERPGAAPPVKDYAQKLAKTLTDSAAIAEQMLKEGDLLVASSVEWLTGQRIAFETLEQEIRQGVGVVPAILQRETILK